MRKIWKITHDTNFSDPSAGVTGSIPLFKSHHFVVSWQMTMTLMDKIDIDVEK